MTGLTAGLAAGAVASMMAAGAMMNPSVRRQVNRTARKAENQMGDVRLVRPYSIIP